MTILHTWEALPQGMRLGQLLTLAQRAAAEDSLYYVEDDALVAAVVKAYSNLTAAAR